MNSIEIPDPQHLAIGEYGDPNGQPVFFFHGWPSSRTMAQITEESAPELGVRIISPDRPGIGESSLHLERKLRDWPPVLEKLADRLGIGEFRILAISGGAPYAFAAAHALPERIRAMSVVSGAPPISELSDHTGLLWLYRLMLKAHRISPEILRHSFRLVKPFASRRIPIRIRPLLLKLFKGSDAEVLRDNVAFERCFESARRAWRQPIDGLLIDAQVYAEPWGFKLEDIRVPVRLWHGKQDRAFSFRLAEDVAKRLPICKVRIVDNLGHFSLPIRRMHEILADLIAL